jgi:hypothetical protein
LSKLANLSRRRGLHTAISIGSRLRKTHPLFELMGG